MRVSAKELKEIDAIRFDGLNADLIMRFIVENAKKAFAFQHINEFLHIHTEEGIVTIKPSDFVVTGGFGKFFVVDEKEFDRCYLNCEF